MHCPARRLTGLERRLLKVENGALKRGDVPRATCSYTSRRKKTMARKLAITNCGETDLAKAERPHLTSQNGTVVLKLGAIGSFRRRGIERSN
jgi:hypothetical protein